MNKPIIERNGRLVRKDLVKIGVLWEHVSKKDPDEVYYKKQLLQHTQAKERGGVVTGRIKSY